MIQETRIELIGPHPKNPRKSLGDLTELADSIKAFGVMQNLTIVPSVDGEHEYTVIIGHRRLAAAKLAELDTVPCQLVDLNETGQIEAMLMENMQREDLTLIEEAEGFQMMLDIGKSIDDICRQTGLSETKVRHRIKLKELDQELLQQKVDGQVKINDLIKLEQIKDLSKRNEVLKTIGTNNFEFSLERALKDQTKEAFKEEILPMIPPEANEKSYIGAWDHTTKTIKYSKGSDGVKTAIEFINDGIKEGKTVDYSFNYDAMTVGYINEEKVNGPSEEDIATREARQKEENRKNKLNDLVDTFSELHKKFAIDCQETALKEHEGTLKAGLVKYLQECPNNSLAIDEVMIALSLNAEEANSDSKIVEAIEGISPLRMLLIILIAKDDANWNSTPVHRYSSKYKEENNWIILMPILQALGYQYSDEEYQLVNGTHPLFKEDNDD